MADVVEQPGEPGQYDRGRLRAHDGYCLLCWAWTISKALSKISFPNQSMGGGVVLAFADVQTDVDIHAFVASVTAAVLWCEGAPVLGEGFDIYCGLDFGKSEHHATVLSPAGERFLDKTLRKDYARLQ